jgi:hypothetical protein
VTADISPTFQSKLFRFDGGVETFGVARGPASASAFQGVTVLSGNILVADYHTTANRIERYSPNGTDLGVFASTTGPSYLESDNSGNVYTTKALSGIATRLNSAGVATQTFSGSGTFSGIDSDSAGNVYFGRRSGSTNQLLKFAPNGTLTNTVSLGTIVPADISIDELSNRLYLADTASTTGIRIFDISGAAPLLIGGIGTPSSVQTQGIYFAPESGNILITDSGFGGSNDPRGLEYSSAGSLLREYRPTSAFVGSDITTLFVPEPMSAMLVLMCVFPIGLKCNRIF